MFTFQAIPLGVDSSRVLEELMDAKPRNAGVEEKLNTIAELIDQGKEAEARSEIETLAKEIGEDDPEITRARMLLEFMSKDDA